MTTIEVQMQLAMFCYNIRHLLCKWNVQRSWQQRLTHHIPTITTLRDEIHRCLIIILEVKNGNNFKKKKSQKDSKRNTHKSETFLKFALSNYMNRIEVWAMYQRQLLHANTDTNMFAEEFHNHLETFFQQERKPNRREDDFINLLLGIEEEDFWHRKSDLQYKSSIPQLSSPHESRHKNGFRIGDKNVQHVETCVRQVKSQSKTFVDIWHTETRSEQDCYQAHCFEKCLELSCFGLCSHIPLIIIHVMATCCSASTYTRFMLSEYK